MSASALFWMALVAASVSLTSLSAAESASTDSAALARAVRSHVAELSGWKDAEIEVQSIRNLNRIDLPPGDLSFRVLQKNAPAGYRNLLLPIEACQDGKAVRTFWIMADVTIRARVLQAVRRLRYGATISSGDVRAQQIEITDPRAQYIRTADEAIGRTLRRILLPGEPLTRDCITNPFLVRTGDTVKLKLKYGSISAAALARAEQNGKLGQSIRVRNLDFPRPVRAEVTGPGEVTIE